MELTLTDNAPAKVVSRVSFGKLHVPLRADRAFGKLLAKKP